MSSSDIHEVQRKLRQLDVVFVIDTTGSMAQSILQVKRRLKWFANELATTDVGPRVAFGVVAYRDHPPQDKTYVTKVLPLTDEIKVAQANISSLKARGGGDGPEAVLDGLHEAINNLNWREYAHKVVVLVGDAPPHGVGAPGDKWPQGCPCGLNINTVTTQAQSRGVVIHAVGVRSNNAMSRSFRQIALATEGEFVPLTKVSALIDRILELLRAELGKVAADIEVFQAWVASADKSASGLAGSMGIPAAEVGESLKRLQLKGVLAVDQSTSDVFRAMLTHELDSETSAIVQDVDPDLLDQIKLGVSVNEHSLPDNDIDIRILDE